MKAGGCGENCLGQGKGSGKGRGAGEGDGEAECGDWGSAE